MPLTKGTETTDTSDSEQDYQETTTITSDYGFKYHREHGFTLKDDSRYDEEKNQIEYFHENDANNNFLVSNDRALIDEPGKQTLIVKTIIHSENQELNEAVDEHENRQFHRNNSSNNNLFNPSHSLEKTFRSQSASCLLGI